MAHLRGYLIKFPLVTLVAGLASAASGQNVPAANDQSATDDNEIVVTGTKMGETRLQTTPLAITAIGGEELTKSGVRDVQDLKNYVPSLQVSDLSGYTQLYLRGIGSNIVFIGSDPSTTMHLDGVYLSRPLSYLNDFLDVERVEVLRGPQGTLYGRNSVGGTINIVSRAPSNVLTAQFVGEYGTYDRYAAKGYISGPLAGDVAASLAFDISGHDGFRENVSTGPDMESQKSRGVRGQIRVPVGAGGSFTLRADYSRQSGTFGGYPKLTGPVGVPLDDSILADPDKVALDGDSFTVMENYGVVGDLSLNLGSDFELRSITAWRGLDGTIDTDADSSSLPLFRTFIGPIRQRQVSQEFNLVRDRGPLRFVLGAYYFEERNREPLTFTIFPFGVSHVQRPLLKARSYAAFGQAEYGLTDKLALVAGLRYSAERKSYVLHDRFTFSTSLDISQVEAAPNVIGIPGVPDPFTVDTTRKDHALTPKVGVNFTPTEDLLFYVSATRGFKSGGFDYGASNAADAAAGYGPEKLWSYEAGMKSDWLNRRLRVNLTAFSYDYTDLQVQNYVQIGASFGARTETAATARVKGMEAEIVAKPVPALQLFANVAYLDATYKSYPNAFVVTFGNFDASGKRLNNAPSWSATIGANYTVELGKSGSVELGVDTHLQSKVYFTAANDGVGGVSGYGEQQGGYGLLNGRIGWTSADERWGIALVGTNLADHDYYVGTANYTPAISARQGRPREIFGQIMLRY